MITFTVNQESARFEGDPDTPLLWVLRDHLDMPGTRINAIFNAGGVRLRKLPMAQQLREKLG